MTVKMLMLMLMIMSVDNHDGMVMVLLCIMVIIIITKSSIRHNRWIMMDDYKSKVLDDVTLMTIMRIRG